MSPRRPVGPALQLPLVAAAEVEPASGACQRWSGGSHRWRRRRDGGFDRTRYRAVRISNAVAKRMVEREHYLHTFPAARLSWGLYEGHQLLGVAVLGVPSHPAVVRNVFPDLQPYHESLVLSRFVLVDAVPANGESWFLGQVFAAAAREGLRGVVSFADPVVRRAADGHLVVPGHAGLIYQAKGAVALGRSDAATVLVLADGTTLDRRALSKVRRGECGHEYVERRLAGFGAPMRRPGESGGAFLARALPAAGVVALRHGGCYRYGFRLGVTRAQRATVRIALPGGPYPKAIDDTSWRLATPLTADVAPNVRAALLL